MQIHHETTDDVLRYIEENKDVALEGRERNYRSILAFIRNARPVDARTRMLEIGTGLGWFPLLCQRDGLCCKGLDISPQFIEYARELGARYGLEANIELGNIEETDIGAECYDVIVASSVFEHIQYWRKPLERIYQALTPGGALFFESSNKFSVISGEYGLPFYGWFPDAGRYWIRKTFQHPDIMKLGIDFHQFTYPGLRRAFEEVGFTRILDRVDLADSRAKGPLKRTVMKAAGRSMVVRSAFLTFVSATTFVCVK